MEPAQEITDYTFDYIYKLPDGKRTELLDGQIYMLSEPGRQHQELVNFLDMVTGYLLKNNTPCCLYNNNIHSRDFY